MNLRGRPRLAKHVTGKFFKEFQVKSRLFGHFFRDGLEWKAIQAAPVDFADTRSLRAKRVFMLRMSIECFLKSIFIALSGRTESAKEVYRRAVGCKHDLRKLLEGCSSRAQGRYRIGVKILRDRLLRVNELGVGIRYEADFMAAMRCESPAERAGNSGLVTGVILDDEFVAMFQQDSTVLMKLAIRINKKRLGKHKAVTGKNIGVLEKCVFEITRPQQRAPKQADSKPPS